MNSRRVVEDLVLVRALVPVKRGMTPAWFAKSLERYRRPDTSPAAWNTLVSQTLEQLVEQNYLLAQPFRLTDLGRDRIRAFFNGQLPGRGTKWSTITRTWIPSVVLGLVGNDKAMKRIAAADGFRAAIISAEDKLPVSQTPTERQALDALVWRALGIETDKQLSISALHEHVLRTALDGPRAKTVNELTNLYVARLVGSRSVDIEAIRNTWVRKMIGPDTSNESAGAEGSDQNGQPPETHSLGDLDQFVVNVKRTALSSSVERFGDTKAFIASLFDAMPNERDLDQFKARLLKAHHDGQLRLQAANLVDAMDPALVARSESQFMNAYYHLVEISE